MSNTVKELCEHLKELIIEESYSESTSIDMNFIIDRMLEYADMNGIEEYSESVGESFVTYCEKDLQICGSRVTRAKNIVGKLSRLSHGLDGKDALWPRRFKVTDDCLPEWMKDLLSGYTKYCRNVGNKEYTIYYKRWICIRFLANLAELGCCSADDIDSKNIQSAFLALGFNSYWGRIRGFMKYLFDAGVVNRDYSTLISYKKSSEVHPVTYTQEEISKTEDSIDRSTPAGVRNYAIMLLISRYGIRARDIAAMTTDNIDFDNDRIRFVQQKTGDMWEGPLFLEVKEALLNYINNARPDVPDYSELFLTCMIPYKPIDQAIVNTMIGDVFNRSGVNISGKRHGSRALRSAKATNMVNDGVSTETVRRIMGHGTSYALRHYAKIDIKSMRICPLPVPEPSGKFAEKLCWKGGNR